MRATVYHVLLTLALILGMIAGDATSAQALPLTEVLAQAQPSSQAASKLKAQYRAELQERKRVQDSLAQLERQYDLLASKIDALKRKGISNLNRGEHQELMRQGRRLAEQLGQLQLKIQRIDSSLDQLAGAILSDLDVQLRASERALIGASGPQRRQLVAQLNALSQERAEYAQPLPALDLKKAEAMLKMAQGLDNPDDMLAMADELQDAEQELLKKLDWVSSRLTDLKARKRLLQRATAFSREERFFEESARSRSLARLERRNEAPTSAPPQKATDDASSPIRGSGDDFASESAAPDLANGADPDTARGPDAVSSPGIESGKSPQIPTDNRVDDPFAQPKDTIIISREADPSAGSAQRAGADDSRLDDKIKALERDQKALQQQAEALKRRAKKLRQEANL